MGDGLVNTFAIRQQFEWAWLNKTPAAAMWHGFKAEEFGYDEEIRLDTKDLIDRAELFIITLGLSEIWYDEVSGEVFWRAVPKDHYDPARHKFRVATHDENLENLHAIYALIRQHRPNAHILFSLSPIPLTATFRPIGCMSADSVSKAILRSALDEFLRSNGGDEHLHYLPSYEVVTRLFSNQWDVDRKHVVGHVLTFNMRLFEAFYCTPGIEKEVLNRYLKSSLEEDVRIGMQGNENDGMSYLELRQKRVDERRQARIDTRVAEREQKKISLAEKKKQTSYKRNAYLLNHLRTAATIGIAATLGFLANGYLSAAAMID
jgi:hypothetical protein